MNIHTHISEAEQRRSAAATRARLMGKPARVPPRLAPVVQIAASRKPVDVSYHMVLYRAYQANLRATFSMATSFTINPVDEYCPYHSEIVFQTEEIPEQRRSMKEIAAEILRKFPGITMDIIKGSRRDRAAVIPRHLIMYSIKKEQPWRSFPEIGRFVNKDHSVAVHANNKLKAELEGDVISIAKHKRKKDRTASYHLAAR